VVRQVPRRARFAKYGIDRRQAQSRHGIDNRAFCMIEGRIRKPDGVAGRIVAAGMSATTAATANAQSGMAGAVSVSPTELGCDNEKPATRTQTAPIQATRKGENPNNK